MKLIMRIDDVGYSKVHNTGSFRTVDEGIATSADVMLDCPGTVEALEFLRERPWISVGWHTHFWGAPVLDPSEVPSLVETVNGEVRFKQQMSWRDDVDYDELRKERRAQIERCIDILGRTPDVGAGGHGDSAFSRALKDTCEEYAMPYDIFAKGKYDNNIFFQGRDIPEPTQGHIYAANPESELHQLPRAKMDTMTLLEAVSYNPWRYFLEDPAHFLDYADDEYVFYALHPGAVDSFVMSRGSNKHYYLCRPIDADCLCSQEIHDWVKNNNVELSNMRDGLYGTKSYQIHLKHIGSDLYKG